MMNRWLPGAAAVALSVLLPTMARSEEIAVAIFGGSFLENSKQCHGRLFEAETGARVNYVLGSSVENAAKLRATKGRPSVDIAYMDLSIVKQAKAEKLLSKIDTSKVKNIEDLHSEARDRDDAYVGLMYGATAIAYNPKMVSTPPTSWNDLWNPVYRGKMALPDITGTAGQHFLLVAARLRGGSIDNVDPGFEAIKQLKSHAVTFYTQADQIVSLLERGDIVVAPWYVDRVGAAAAKGVPVALAFPKEGAVGIIPTISIPAGARNVDLAHKYIDVVLSVRGQECFAQRQYAGPVNKKVHVTPTLANAIPYGDNIKNMYFPDTEIAARKLPEWTERWGREIAR